MMATHSSAQATGQQSEIVLQRQWPHLGKELFTLESALTRTGRPNEAALTERARAEQRERIKEKIIAQLYRNEDKHSRDARYCALLFVEKSRGGEIVRNPYYRGKEGQKHELP